MGALQDQSKIIAETGPEVAGQLRDEGVDVVLLTPTRPFCTSAAGILARIFEAAGLSTTSFSLVREHTEKIKPPRALFLPVKERREASDDPRMKGGAAGIAR